MRFLSLSMDAQRCSRSADVEVHGASDEVEVHGASDEVEVHGASYEVDDVSKIFLTRRCSSSFLFLLGG